MLEKILLLVLSAAGAIFCFYKLFRRVTIYEYEKGIKYSKGKYVKLLGAGIYWYSSITSKIIKIDTRPQFITVPSQEILSKDGISIKISLAANYEVKSPEKVINNTKNYEESFYLILQIALREIIGASTIDQILEERQTFGKKIIEKVGHRITENGINLISLDIKDITFPGVLKQTFAQVAKARQQGLAALERARGEKAALRSLANSAKMLNSNPALMQLRAMQTINETSGNTLVLNLNPETVSLQDIVVNKEKSKDGLCPQSNKS